jgi:hypothetical protein
VRGGNVTSFNKKTTSLDEIKLAFRDEDIEKHINEKDFSSETKGIPI